MLLLNISLVLFSSVVLFGRFTKFQNLEEVDKGG